MTPEEPRPKKLRILTPRLGAMVLALILATVLMLLIGKCSHEAVTVPFKSGMPPKSGGDTIDVAIEISPLSYSLAGDTIAGLDYDMLRDFAASQGRPVKFHPFAPLDFALRGLRQGNFDIVVSSLPSTARLKERLLLTDRVYLDREVLVQRRDDSCYVATADGLAGDTVWIADGSPFAERLANLGAEIGDTIYVKQRPGMTAEHLMMLVAAGEVRRAVINDGLAARMVASNANLDASTPVSFTQFQTWALDLDRGKDLQQAINDWLPGYQQSQRYRRLIKNYLGRDAE